MTTHSPHLAAVLCEVERLLALFKHAAFAAPLRNAYAEYQAAERRLAEPRPEEVSGGDPGCLPEGGARC